MRANTTAAALVTRIEVLEAHAEIRRIQERHMITLLPTNIAESFPASSVLMQV